MPTREGNVMFALHRYYLTASATRTTFMRFLDEHPEGPFANDGLLFPEFIAHMSMWYSSLYVAFEGWNGLHIANPILEAAWENPLRSTFKEYRNATVHFTRHYVDRRMTEFIAHPDAVGYSHHVHYQLGQAILAELDRLSVEPISRVIS
jgi:hypothetical protein